MSIKNQTKEKMEASLEHFKNDLKSLRTGRANPAMLDSINVEVYGTQMRLRDMAQISTPDPRQLLITPFDPSNIPAIEKAIKEANIGGFMPNIDGHVLRINVPPMDSSLRDQMVKQCHKMKEDTKISIRGARQTGNNEARKQKDEIGEDMVKKTEKDIQELTDKYCKDIDSIAAEKEKEIVTI